MRGRIGHTSTECSEPVAEEMIELGNFQYGDWLKAASFSGNSYGSVGNARRGGGHHRLGSDANQNLQGRYCREEDYGGTLRSDSSCAKGFFLPKPLERNQRRSKTVSIDVESDLQDYAGIIEGVFVVPRADFLGKQSELNVISYSSHSNVLGYVGDGSKLVEDDMEAKDKGRGIFTESCACASKSRDLIKTSKGLMYVHETFNC